MKQILLALLIIVLLALAAGLYSCRSMSKSASSIYSNVDSSISVKVQKEKVKTARTITTDNRNIQKKGNVKLIFTYPKNDTSNRKPVVLTGDKVNDALQYLMNQNPASVDVDADFDILDRSKVITATDKKDAAVSKKNSHTDISKSKGEEHTAKNVKGVSFSWSAAFWLIMATVVAIIIFLKKNWFVQLFLKIKSLR